MDTEERLQKIEAELESIKERNTKVEANKAWETSFFRIASLVLATYIVAALALVSIANDHPFRNALIPAIGFFLSTQSLPFLKRRWMQKYSEKKSGKGVY